MSAASEPLLRDAGGAAPEDPLPRTPSGRLGAPSRAPKIERENSSRIIFPALRAAEGDKPDYWGTTAKAWENIVPDWAVNGHVRELAMRLRTSAPSAQEPLPLQCAVGPAVPWALWASHLAWLLFLCVPVPAYMLSYCVGSQLVAGISNSTNSSSMTNELDNGESEFKGGYAAYNAPAVWAIGGPAILGLLLIEWWCLQYYLIPQVQTTGGFKAFGIRSGFMVWLPISFMMSAVSHADLITNGAFFATSWKMDQCSFGVHLHCIWNSTMSQSSFSYVPGLVEHVQIPFPYLVAIFWMLMPLQALYGVIGATPLPNLYHRCMKHSRLGRWLYSRFEKKRNWWPDGITQDVKKPNAISHDYTTLEAHRHRRWTEAELQDWWDNDMMYPGLEKYLHEMCNYNPTSFNDVMAFVGGGPGIGLSYQTFFDEDAKSTSDHGSALLSLADSNRMSTITSMKVSYARHKIMYYFATKRSGAAFGVTKRVLQSALYKVMLSGILQGGVQVNLQLTLFALTTVLQRPNHNGPLYLTDGIRNVNKQMLVSVAVGVCVMGKNLLEALQIWYWVRHVLSIPVSDGGFPESDGVNNFRSILQHRSNILGICLAVYVVLTLYAMAKFWGIFYCQDSMFNVNGCATIEATCFQ